MIDLIRALGPLYSLLALLVVCLTILGVISRIVMAFERKPKTEQQPTSTDQST